MAFNSPEIERRARPKRKWLEEHEGEYARAKDWIDKYGERDRDHLLEDLTALIDTYRPSDPPHVAVYMIAQMKQTVADANFHRNILRDYELKQEEMRALSQMDLDSTGEDPTPTP